MLERVKDFRYEEIKNWKPIVSLRESYARENALKSYSLYLMVPAVVLLGYLVLTGGLFRFETDQPKPGTDLAATTKQTAPGPVQQGAAKSLANANIGNSSFGTKPTANRIASVPQNPPAGSIAQTSYGGAAPLRVAVCDFDGLWKELINDLQVEMQREAQEELEQELREISLELATWTENETRMFKRLMDQKKELAKIKIRETCEEQLEAYRQYYQPVLNAVGKEMGFEMIVPADSVLAHSKAVDITNEVAAEIRYQQNQKKAGKPSLIR